MTAIRTWRNWAGTASCAPAALHDPPDAAGVAAIVAAAAERGERVKVAGSGHSFTGAACTDGHLIRLSRMTGVASVDQDARRVTVLAGTRIDALARALAAHGLALPSLGDIGTQTVAGAIATGTHGTGLRFGGIAAQVRALEMVLADGSTLWCSADSQPEVFHAARVGLGALGVVVAVTLQCEEAFTLHAVEEPVALPEVLDRFGDLARSDEHAEFFWFPHTERALLKRNNRTSRPPRPPGPVRAWIDDVLLANHAFGLACRAGRARPEWIPGIAHLVGRALSRREYSDRSDRVFTSPRLVRFAEMEYALPFDALREGIDAVRAVIDGGGYRVSFPVEVRTGAAEDALLSPAFGRPTCYVAVHVFSGMPYEALFRAVEQRLSALDGRPHWGKLHFREASSLAPAYPGWSRFAAVRTKLDSSGVFRNDYLDRVLGRP